jgi:hypothetical protein
MSITLGGGGIRIHKTLKMAAIATMKAANTAIGLKKCFFRDLIEVSNVFCIMPRR